MLDLDAVEQIGRPTRRHELAQSVLWNRARALLAGTTDQTRCTVSLVGNNSIATPV